MKKKTIAFLAVGLISMLLWGACKSSATSPTATPSGGKAAATEGQASPAAKATTPSGASGGAAQAGDFHGLPLPQGAKEIQTLSYQLPGGIQQGGYGKVEWKGYKVDLKTNEIIDFYKKEMPQRDWVQSFWMEGAGADDGTAMGIYFKDNQNQAAWIYVMPEGEEFDLLLMWAEGKK